MTPMRERGTHERGLTLLEVLVALVVLSLVGLGYLQLFHGSHRLVADSREWSEAVAHAEDAIEQAKLGSLSLRNAQAETLPGGFRRQITSRLWQPGLVLVTVTVFLPGGGRFDLDRLARVERTPRAGAGPEAPPPGEPW
jgi:prepilin-type N-terminal cleavage/methylation domain-containing protein